jgi:hypothetical protein
MAQLPPTYTLPAPLPSDLAPTDQPTLTMLIQQLQAVPGGTDNLPPFLGALISVLNASMSGTSPTPGRPLSLGALVLDAVAAWGDANDASFAQQLRIEAQFLAAVRAQLAV